MERHPHARRLPHENGRTRLLRIYRDDKSWEFSGNTTAEHTRSNDITTTDITNFIPSGDTYDNRFAHAIGHNLTLTTDNELKLRPKTNIST